MPGEGSLSRDIALSDDGSMKLELLVRFKVGKLANWGSKILTGHLAPSAWMRVQYNLWPNGLLDLQFSGSSIPSQKNYLKSREVFHHDMLDLDQGTVNGFIAAGDCKNAPTRRFPMLLSWVPFDTENISEDKDTDLEK
jgi:hypothetical protein